MHPFAIWTEISRSFFGVGRRLRRSRVDNGFCLRLHVQGKSPAGKRLDKDLHRRRVEYRQGSQQKCHQQFIHGRLYQSIPNVLKREPDLKTIFRAVASLPNRMPLALTVLTPLSKITSPSTTTLPVINSKPSIS